MPKVLDIIYTNLRRDFLFPCLVRGRDLIKPTPTTHTHYFLPPEQWWKTTAVATGFLFPIPPRLPKTGKLRWIPRNLPSSQSLPYQTSPLHAVCGPSCRLPPPRLEQTQDRSDEEQYDLNNDKTDQHLDQAAVEVRPWIFIEDHANEVEGVAEGVLMAFDMEIMAEQSRGCQVQDEDDEVEESGEQDRDVVSEEDCSYAEDGDEDS